MNRADRLQWFGLSVLFLLMAGYGFWKNDKQEKTIVSLVAERDSLKAEQTNWLSLSTEIPMRGPFWVSDSSDMYFLTMDNQRLYVQVGLRKNRWPPDTLKTKPMKREEK